MELTSLSDGLETDRKREMALVHVKRLLQIWI